MLERPYKQLEALISISQAIFNYQSLDDLFNGIAAELRSVIKFDLIIIWRLTNEGGSSFISTGEESAPIPPMPTVNASNPAALRWVYDRQEPLVIASLAEDPRFRVQLAILRQSGVQSLCAL